MEFADVLPPAQRHHPACATAPADATAPARATVGRRHLPPPPPPPPPSPPSPRPHLPPPAARTHLLSHRGVTVLSAVLGVLATITADKASLLRPDLSV